jgi:hypothetical protein
MSLTKVSYSLIKGEIINVFDYLTDAQITAVQTNTYTTVTDVTAALNSAFANIGKVVFLPKGTYKITSNLNVPQCSQIIGESTYATTIVAASGVTAVLEFNNTTYGVNITRLANFNIVGNATIGAVGLYFGQNNIVSNLLVENVTVSAFTGSAAVACFCKNVLLSTFINCYFVTSNIGLLCEGSDTSLPTTLSFIGGGARQNNVNGVKIVTGKQLVFQNFDFESNVQEALYVVPAAASVLSNITFSDCWFEGNYPSPLQYEVLLDGSNIPAACSVYIIRPYFNNTVSGAKSIRVIGSIIFSLQDVRPNIDLSFPIKIEGTTCIGEISLDRLTENGYYSSYVSDVNNRAHNLKSFVINNVDIVGTNVTNTGTATFKVTYCKNGSVVTGSIRIVSSTGTTSATANSTFFDVPSEFPVAHGGNCAAATSATASLGVGTVVTGTNRIYVPSWTTQTDVTVTFWYYTNWII